MGGVKLLVFKIGTRTVQVMMLEDALKSDLWAITAQLAKERGVRVEDVQMSLGEE